MPSRRHSHTLLRLALAVLACLLSSSAHDRSVVRADDGGGETAVPSLRLEDMNAAAVEELLASWKLGRRFAQLELDGGMLARLTARDVETEIRGRALHALAEAVRPRATAERHAGRGGGGADAAAAAALTQRRRGLVAAGGTGDADAPSGVHIKNNKSAVLLGVAGDVELRRVGDRQLLVNNSIEVGGDLEVAGRLVIRDEDDGSQLDVFKRFKGALRSQRALEDRVHEVNATLHAYAAGSSSSGHGSDAYGWTHVASFGCADVLSASAVGKEGDECFKLSDADIKDLMCSNELKVEFFTTHDTLFVQLVDTDGTPREFHYDPQPNAAKWRWVDTLPWKGPCTHDAQLLSGYFFFFKTATHYGDCEASNFENTVDATAGFQNRDSATFFPMTGWDPHIQMFVRTVCD